MFSDARSLDALVGRLKINGGIDDNAAACSLGGSEADDHSVEALRIVARHRDPQKSNRRIETWAGELYPRLQIRRGLHSRLQVRRGDDPLAKGFLRGGHGLEFERWLFNDAERHNATRDSKASVARSNPNPIPPRIGTTRGCQCQRRFLNDYGIGFRLTWCIVDTIVGPSGSVR